MKSLEPVPWPPGTTRNYSDVGQDFDGVRQGSNLKVDADTLSLIPPSIYWLRAFELIPKTDKV